MRPSQLLPLVVLVACGGAAVPAATTPVPPASAPSMSSAASPPASVTRVAPTPPPMTPGVVNIGDIVAPAQFDPKPTMAEMKPELLRCYNEARSLVPGLHGKLTLRVYVSDSGAVTSTEGVAGGSANDPGLVACIADAMKAATFPKPGGLATISVPLVFRP